MYVRENNSVRTITTNNYFSWIGNTTDALGVFENRKVHLRDSGQTLLSNLNGSCVRMFRGTDLYIPTSTTDFNLANVTNCQYMFYGCKSYKYNSESVYNDNNRIFVEVTLPTNCSYYNNMFDSSQILKRLPNINSAQSQNMSYMYASCVILQSEIVLPPTYFQICKNSIVNVAYMFYKNRYITELGYDSKYGLFDGCVYLNNVDGMFLSATYLHKGIPNNIFGTTNLPNIIRLYRMFELTNVLYDIPNEIDGGKMG